MKSKDVNKFIIFIFVILVILNFYCILREYNHNCTHTNDCSICISIHALENDLNGIGFKSFSVILFCILFIRKNRLYNNKTNLLFNRLTLVKLKVKINN